MTPLFALPTLLHAADTRSARKELEQLVARALENSPLVGAARARVLQELTRQDENFAFFEPSLSGLAGTAERDRGIPGGTGFATSTNNATVVQGGIEAPVRPGAYVSAGAAERFLREPGGHHSSVFQTLVGMQVRMISTFVGLAFMAAASARVGQNLGGGRPDRAEQSGWASAVIATAFMSVIACLLFLFPEHVMAFFTSDREVIAMGRTFFIIVAVTEPIMALSFAMGGALRGGGDPMSPFIYGSVSDLLVVIVAGYVLAVTLNMGFAGIALGMAISAVTRAIPTMLKFRQGKWKSARF